MMYLNILKGRISAIWDALFPRGLRRSPVLPFMVIFVVIAIPTGAWMLHVHGNFHKIKTSIDGAPVAESPRPGGLAPLVLRAPRKGDEDGPQFLSVTMLPGLGMDVLQITAYLPGRGEVPLLEAPSLQAMADGTVGPRSSSDDMRGAIEAPWAGGLTGNVSPVGSTMTVSWRGRTIEVPTDPDGEPGVARGGLLSRRGADANVLSPEGNFANAYFHPTDFDEHWISQTETSITAGLSAHSFNLVVVMHNRGTDPEPLGIGWHPRFAILSGDRKDAEVELPQGQMLEVTNRAKDEVSGRFIAAPADVRAFMGHASPLGGVTLEAVLAHLTVKSGSAATAEILDPKSGFGLRMTATNPSVRELSVSAPADRKYISLGMQTNYEDPLGRNWTSAADPGVTTMQPTEAITFHIRLDIFAVPRP